MLKYLASLVILFLVGCQNAPISKPGTDLSKLSLDAGELDSCDANKPCRYRLNATINRDSVSSAISWISSAEKAGSTVFVLELNTPGGSVPAGFELAKKIEEAKVPVVCVVDGMAASMGFYILQSCPLRVMTARSMLMIHEPSLSAEMSGPPNDWDAVTEALKAMREAMAYHCNRRLTTTIQEYHAKTDGGKAWWFSWVDAKKYHAIDLVVNNIGEVMEELSKVNP